MEDYGFEYSDDEPEEQDVDIENQYYNSKGTWNAVFKICNYILFFVIWCFPVLDSYSIQFLLIKA